jgi:cell division protease FtsH
LKDKKVSKDVNLEDIANMIQYSSCAELENFLNEAAILAAFERKDSISMSHLVQAILRSEYESPDQYTKTSEEELRKTALHEAGHLVVSEVLLPGSVGLASIRSSGRDSTGGFIRRCKDFPRRPYHILTSLAGKAAVELYYSETCASGCQKDIQKAYNEIRMAISQFGTCGFGMIDVSTRYCPDPSQDMIARSEAVVHAELERYMLKARDILLKNRDFLDKATALLLKKETLLFSDIKALRESSNLVSVAV